MTRFYLCVKFENTRFVNWRFRSEFWLTRHLITVHNSKSKTGVLNLIWSTIHNLPEFLCHWVSNDRRLADLVSIVVVRLRWGSLVLRPDHVDYDQRLTLFPCLYESGTYTSWHQLCWWILSLPCYLLPDGTTGPWYLLGNYPGCSPSSPRWLVSNQMLAYFGEGRLDGVCLFLSLFF